MTNIHPYVTFNGQAREAMEFYQQCIGGKVVVQTMGESPLADQVPEEKKDHLMHASLTKGGVLLLMASDMVGDNGIKRGNDIQLSLLLDDEAEAKTVFDKLSAGGKVVMPLTEAFWGDIFGQLVDQYGVQWMINCEKPKKSS